MQIMRLIHTAAVKRAELGEALKAALEAHESARVAARVRRKEPSDPKTASAGSRTVAVLPSGDIQGNFLTAARLAYQLLIA